jgi:hypothetical protein
MKSFIVIFYLMALVTYANSQEIEPKQEAPIQIDEQPKEKEPFKNKLYTGGNLGLTFGTYTNVMIAPILGIRWSPKFSTELGVEYNYTKDNRYESEYSYNQYGGRVNAQYFIIPQLFAHAEFAGLSMEQYNLNYNKKERNFVPFLYLGAGYRQYMSKRSYVSFRILFDVLNNENSPYSPGEPYFSVGFGVGI